MSLHTHIMQVFLTFLTFFIKEHKLAFGFFMLGLICLVYGLIDISMPKQDTGAFTFHGSEANNAEKGFVKSDKSKISISPNITIDIEGAVIKPGVYSLKSDARIRDALHLAGGFSPEADTQKIAQSINLASPLTDGAKVYIPSITDETQGSSNLYSDISQTSGVLGTNSRQININQANESELDSLDGVGKITAQKIITNRPYKNIQALTEKKVIGQSVFEKIKNQITVY